MRSGMKGLLLASMGEAREPREGRMRVFVIRRYLAGGATEVFQPRWPRPVTGYFALLGGLV